ncbi:MAG: hypothetical protein ACFFDM_00025 [Candidatus Thorarchaeota archaeon]
MVLSRAWLIIFSGIICVSLAILGGFLYPLSSQGILAILAYEIVVILGVVGLLALVKKKALEDW